MLASENHWLNPGVRYQQNIQYQKVKKPLINVQNNVNIESLDLKNDSELISLRIQVSVDKVRWLDDPNNFRLE